MIKRNPKIIYQSKPKGVMKNGSMVPFSVAFLENMRRLEFSGKNNSVQRAKETISKIREKGNLGKLRTARNKLEITPEKFMQKTKINSKTMFVLTSALLTLINQNRGKNKKVILKSPFEIANQIRTKVPSLPEQMIQNYANWTYLFLQKKGNQKKLELFNEKAHLKSLKN